MSNYAQGKAEKRRASDVSSLSKLRSFVFLIFPLFSSQSAYATKSAGYWAKTSEGRDALERYEQETKRCKEKQNQGLQSRIEFCQIELVRSVSLLPFDFSTDR